MRGVIAIARRDLASTFLVPTGWIILAGWGLIASIIFAFASLREGEPATLRAVISMAGWAIAVVAPAISMRSFAEEARLGTLEVLLTSPLSALELVLGKFLAGVGVLLVLGIPILVLFGVAEIYGDPDPGELASGLLGLLLAGATLIALGLVVSTRTSSQVVAYLVTFFIFFAVVLVAKGVPVLIEFLPADLLAPERTLAWIEWASGLDPLLRLDEFAIGLFDSANVGWFIAASAFFLFLGGFSLAAPRRVRAASRAARLVAMLLSAVGILGAAVSAIAFSTLMEAPPLRVEADLTKTRAYSLQESTVDLLESLEPGWSVRLLVARDDADPVTMRQVDEVVQRMDQVTPNLEAERIDPVDPRSIGRYEAVLESLLSRDAATIAIWEEKIQAGVDAFEALQAVGREVAPSAAALLPQIPADSPIHSLIERVGLVFGTLADQGGAFTAFIDETLRSTSRRPLPNWRLAQASLAANNAKQAGEIEQVADVLRQWEIDPGIPAAARDWAALTIPAIESVAVVLRASGDELAVLEEAHPLVAAVIAESIAEGDVAIVDGPRGSLVIPAWQLFPASAVRQVWRRCRRRFRSSVPGRGDARRGDSSAAARANAQSRLRARRRSVAPARSRRRPGGRRDHQCPADRSVRSRGVDSGTDGTTVGGVGTYHGVVRDPAVAAEGVGVRRSGEGVAWCGDWIDRRRGAGPVDRGSEHAAAGREAGPVVDGGIDARRGDRYRAGGLRVDAGHDGGWRGQDLAGDRRTSAGGFRIRRGDHRGAAWQEAVRVSRHSDQGRFPEVRDGGGAGRGSPQRLAMARGRLAR